MVIAWITTAIHFILSSKFCQKYSHKIILVHTKSNEINLQVVWWALIEEIAPHAEGVAGEKEMACCVRGYYICLGNMRSSNWGSAGV